MSPPTSVKAPEVRAPALRHVLTTAEPWWLLMPVLFGVLAVMYAPILRDLVVQWWDDPNYSHGFLVPVFSGFLIWQRRAELVRLEWRGTWVGIPVLVFGLGCFILGQVGAELFLSRISLLIIVTGLILFHFGLPLLRTVAFPLLYLLFMIPLPATVFYAVAFPLQSVAARNAATVLDLLGVPVLLDGNVIHLSQITLGVTEACSGIRSLISLIALALAWAYVSFPQTWAIVLLAVSAIPITIVANAARIVSTGLAGQWIGVQYAQGFFHSFSGWAIFVFAFLCLLAVHGVLRLGMTLWSRRRA